MTPKDILSNSKELLSNSKDVLSNSKELLSNSKDILSNSKELLSDSKDILSNSKERLCWGKVDLCPDKVNRVTSKVHDAPIVSTPTARSLVSWYHAVSFHQLKRAVGLFQGRGSCLPAARRGALRSRQGNGHTPAFFVHEPRNQLPRSGGGGGAQPAGRQP